MENNSELEFGKIYVALISFFKGNPKSKYIIKANSKTSFTVAFTEEQRSVSIDSCKHFKIEKEIEL